MKPQSISLHITAITHVGLKRDHNEDTLAAGFWVRTEPMDSPHQIVLPLDRRLACLVADGMGGHTAGEVASFFAATSFINQAAYLPDSPAVASCLQSISDEIQKQMDEHPECQGMGTTIAGLLFDKESICGFNVGDSRVYQIRTGYLRQLSTDHVPQFQTGEVFDPEQGNEPPPKSGRLLQCLGGMGEALRIAPFTINLPVQPGAVYLICSDGLTDMVSDDDLEACLKGEDLDAVELMLKAALEAGGQDNITIMLVRVGADEGKREIGT